MSSIDQETVAGSGSRLLNLPAEIRIQILEYILHESIVFYRKSDSDPSNQHYAEHYLVWNTGIMTVNRQMYRESCSICSDEHRKMGLISYGSVLSKYILPWSAASISGIQLTKEFGGYYAYLFSREISKRYEHFVGTSGTASHDLAVLSQSRGTSNEIDDTTRYVFGIIKSSDRKDVIEILHQPVLGRRYVRTSNSIFHHTDSLELDCEAGEEDDCECISCRSY